MRNIRVLTHINSYETFFDHRWSGRLDELVDGTRLADPAFALCVNWKSAVNSHLMPWLMVTGLKHFWEGNVSGQQSSAGWAIWHLVRQVPAAMAPHLTNMNRKKLAEVMAGVGERCKQLQVQAAGAEEGADVQELFEQFLHGPGSHELGLSIWGTQRIVYGAVFHAYENFVAQCVGLARSDPGYRGFPFAALVSDARAAFGGAAAEYCLSDPFVEVSRQVRNALAHRGGRVDERLAAVDHGIEVLDGVLQITPTENRKLMDGLKVRVTRLVEAARTLPQMK